MSEHLLKKLRLKKEIVLCKQDPIYFMVNYVNCYHQTHGTVPFHPHDYQVEYIDVISKGNTIVAAARQSGSSLTTTIYLFWEAYFQKKSQILAASTAGMSRDNLQLIRHTYMTLPAWLRDYNPIVSDSKHAIRFANGSMIRAFKATECAFRGMTMDSIFFDNFSRISNQKGVLTSAIPAINCTGGKIIIVSSGDGSEVFKDMFLDSANGIGTFKSIRIVPD